MGSLSSSEVIKVTGMISNLMILSPFFLRRKEEEEARRVEEAQRKAEEEARKLAEVAKRAEEERLKRAIGASLFFCRC